MMFVTTCPKPSSSLTFSLASYAYSNSWNIMKKTIRKVKEEISIPMLKVWYRFLEMCVCIYNRDVEIIKISYPIQERFWFLWKVEPELKF